MSFSNWRPWSYVALVVGVHCLILLLPAWLPVFRGAAHTTAFLLAGFVLALAGMFWPGLRVRHLGIILLALPVVLVPLYLGFTLGFPEAAGELVSDSENHGLKDVVRSIGIQFFVSMIMAMGLWMRERYDHFSVRRGGTDREAYETLFDLKQELLPEEQLTFLRYAKLMECGISLIGERMMRMRCVVHAFQRDELIFLYDLMNVPGESESRAALLDATLARPEFHLGTRGRVYLVSHDSRETLDLLTERGFRRVVPERDGELLADIRRMLATVLKDEFKEWRPFTEVQEFYYQPPGASSKASAAGTATATQKRADG
ncbi:MAG: hypothetical protein NXI24_10080 [bacterium]|nr:hypothetical protein [bacterium]